MPIDEFFDFDDYVAAGERIARNIHTRNFESMFYRVNGITFIDGQKYGYVANLEAMIDGTWIPVTIIFNEEAPKGLKFLVELKGYGQKIMDHSPDAQELLRIFGLLRRDNRVP